jgi:acetate kinase
VGEGSGRTRAAAAERLAFLGVAVDDPLNRAPDGDRDISAPAADVRTLVVQSREDIVIARAVRRLIARPQGEGA